MDTEESEQRSNQEDGRLQPNRIIDVMRKDKCTENQTELLSRLMQELDKDKVEQPPNMRNTDRRKLKEKTAEVDTIIKYVPINSLSEVNDLMKAVGNVVAKLLRFKSPKKKEKQEPWWKRRIEGQIKVLRKDTSKLQCLKEGKLNNRDLINRLEWKYRTKRKGLNLVIEELKQRVTARQQR